MRMRNLLVLLMLCFAAWSGRSWGQFETASLVGKVSDTTGAVVPGATVTAVNVETSVAISRVTNRNGEYNIPALRPGTYRITADAQNFKQATAENIQLQVGTNQRVDLTISVATTEVISVREDLQALETDTSQKQQVITSEQIEAFPLLNMDYTDLVPLASGVTQDSAGQDLGTSSLVREGSFNINGQRSTFNNYILDGIDNNAHGTSNQGFSNQVILPTQYSQTEFSIVTTIPSAEYGRSAGGIINVAFKSGTNHLHGTLYESIRNTVANANGFFRAATTTGLPTRTTMIRNQFGGNFGAPIKHDRFF